MAFAPPSRFRDRVKFQRRASAAPVAGVTKGDFADLYGGQSFAADLTLTAGGEDIIGGRLQGRAAHDLWVRYCAATAALLAGDRVVDARDTSQVFNIRTVSSQTSPDGRKRHMFLQLESNGRGG